VLPLLFEFKSRSRDSGARFATTKSLSTANLCASSRSVYLSRGLSPRPR